MSVHTSVLILSIVEGNLSTTLGGLFLLEFLFCNSLGQAPKCNTPLNNMISQSSVL